jgi:hypothetical protein
MKSFLLVGAGLLCLMAAFATPVRAASIIPAERRIKWDPGVRGGITHRTRIAALLDTNATVAAIQAALLAAPSNSVVQLTNGEFRVNAQIQIPSGVTLRGMGVSNTVLKGVAPFSGGSVLRYQSAFDDSWSGEARDLIAPLKDSQSITTRVAHGWAPGDVILIDELESPNGDPPIDNTGSLGNCAWCGRAAGTRPIGQWSRITSVTGPSTATIDPPLYRSYANAPQGVKMSGLTHYAGVEDLSIDNLASAARDTVAVEGAVNSWMTRCELKGSKRRAVWFYGGLWFEFTFNRVTGGIPVGADGDEQYRSDSAYGFFAGPHMSASKISDNIFEKLTVPIAWEGAVSGNVFAYNFITNIWWRNTGDSPRRFGPLMHGPHPYMNLQEGNWSGGRIRADEYWGTSSHMVSFRNRVVQIDRGRSPSQSWTVDVERRNWYWTFVYNVIGGGGGVRENYYELINGESSSYSDRRSTIWKIGYNSLGTGSTLYDTGTLRTMIRFGNWCYRTNNIKAGSGVVSHANGVADPAGVEGDSLYLTSRPAHWGILPWPPYDPFRNNTLLENVSPTNIWAGYFYTFGTNPPARR